MATPSTTSGSLANQQLEALYREVERLAQAARAGQLAAGDVRTQILALLAQQAQAAAKRGQGYLSATYQPARFLMVAFADQLLEHLDWPGQEAWRADPLARQLLTEEHPGRVVLERIGLLLAHPSDNQHELANCYLLALCLGFTGGAAPATIDGLRRRLFQLIFGRAPRSADEIERITPEAYQHVSSWGKRKLLPVLKWWRWAVAVAVAVLLLISVHLWWQATADLSQAVERALAASG